MHNSASFLAQLKDPYALMFAGQGTNWVPALSAAAKQPHAGEFLRETYRAARRLLDPVAVELLTGAPEADVTLLTLLNGDPVNGLTDDPAVSMPGITLAQLAALMDLEGTSLDPRRQRPAALIGHSQGVLGAAVGRAYLSGERVLVTELVALSILIGHAARSVAHRRAVTASASATPMLSVRGVDLGIVEAALRSAADDPHDQATVAVINGRRAYVLAGSTRSLARVERALSDLVQAHNRALDNRETGGSAWQLTTDYLPVGAPFHSPRLEEAVGCVAAWVATINEAGGAIESARATDLASAILTDRCDWPAEVARTVAGGVKWLINLGPGEMLARLTRPLVAGRGVSVVEAGSRNARTDLDTPGFIVPQAADWSRFAPRVVELPDGRRVVDTAFTRLTGRSPIMLAAMTPTTVSPEIVAAAANAGHWTEMAGGGQYSEEVFADNRDGLKALLEPGRAAGFNAMFFDRFMWNLQFGVSKIVTKARAAGAPFDAVTIAAGIPELPEAAALIEELTATGFTFISFKPGTTDQIHQVLDIAENNPDFTIIMQVEDGHAGGHHSWEDLEDLLLATYERIRATGNVVLAVGGGIGTPQRAADFLTGRWSAAYQLPAMPVDAVLIGTAAMAVKEARTSPQVKQLLKDTVGVRDNGGWVGRGQISGGVTSGLSHLDADMYEIANSSAAASRLIHEVGGDVDAINARRDELIEALNRTAKPYFGDLPTMTYGQWARRIVQLAYPYADWTWADRFLDVLHRIEARLNPVDHGLIDTLFADLDAVEDAPAALNKLLAAYPEAESTKVCAADAAWWVSACRKHHKPMPFVPALDADLARWWGTDTLWQSQDERFDADSVRIIPGPLSVAGIDRIDEPVGEMFDRYEAEVVSVLDGQNPASVKVFARLANAADVSEYLRHAPHLEWNGTLVANPAFTMGSSTQIKSDEAGWSIQVRCETAWDQLEGEVNGSLPHAVRLIDIPILVPDSCQCGGYPVVDMERLAVTAYDLLAGAAGVGTTTVNGDFIESLPTVEPGEGFGTVRYQFTYGDRLGRAHSAVTGAALRSQLAEVVPDALVGPCWPAIYAALGSAMREGYPVIEGLVNAVHLDHTVMLRDVLPTAGAVVQVCGRCASVTESSAGRVVRVEIDLSSGGHTFAQLVERFAIRGRVTTNRPPLGAPDYLLGGEPITTARSVLRSVSVMAPSDMTAFANVSGDFNPIHTSAAAAGLSGLQAPLVHGMWLSATAQHLVSASTVCAVQDRPELGVIRGVSTAPMKILSWSYQMYGMVNLGDVVDLTVERVGRLAGGSIIVEVTCRTGEGVVSIGRALVAAPRTAYIYPGQGIQRARMGMEKMTATSRQVWTRADRHTRQALGFSIEAIVRDNPTSIRVGEEELRHPQGVLNLTQFTQVALATLAYAQTQELKADGAFVEGAYYAGHSLGEYNALAACADIFPLEQVLEIVFQRGSAMHHLVERDSQGNSNYRMGALRPNQFGVDHAQVRDYLADVCERCGEFLEIVNYNLAGSQYAVAGTVKGLKFLQEDATARAEVFGGKRPFMLIPGIDVPFHSSVLRAGVPAFREKLESLLPEQLNYQVLEGRYVPNLVARPFALTEDFARSICAAVPSEAVAALLDQGWSQVMKQPQRVARTLLVELLAWQFASPVRWIETQDLLLDPDRLAVERAVEVGLASSPTLANLAAKTLQLPHLRYANVEVLNAERDRDRVYYEDVHAGPEQRFHPLAADGDDVGSRTAESGHSDSVSSSVEAADGNGDSVVAPACDVSTVTASATVSAPAATSSADLPSGAVAASQAPALPVKPSDAVRYLLAWANKITVAQVEADDTVETLTNGVSSKRNQLLMDIAAELGVASIEGAGEATVAQLLEKVDVTASNYQAFGPVLGDAIAARVRKLFGGAGLKPSHVDARVNGTWGLADGWAPRVNAQILLGTREGDSVRGGSLTVLPAQVANVAEADALIDLAVQVVAQEHGLQVSLASGSVAAGEMVDSAALNQLREELLGAGGILASQARQLLSRLGYEPAPLSPVSQTPDELISVLDAELGSGWLDSVAPVFSSQRAVLFDDRWASAREDLARVFSGQLAVEDVVADRFSGAGEGLADLANWYAEHSDVPAQRECFAAVAEAAMKPAGGCHLGEVAVVTGAAPDSIATAVVARLLCEGACVVMTASRVDSARLRFAKELYRRHARVGAALWLVPANLASWRDVDALTEWIGSEQTQTQGATTKVIKPALLPDLFFPFAAPPVQGVLGADPRQAATQERLLLWSVERAIFNLAQLGRDSASSHRIHVVLPGSPNRGTFGGDGAYGEAKSAFDAIVNKWSVERVWSERVTLAHPRIGWVRGTNLMGGNDALIPAAEAAGIHIFTPVEIADELLDLASAAARREAQRGVLDADLTGGLANQRVDLAQLAAQARDEAAKSIDGAGAGALDESPRIGALANLSGPRLAQSLPWRTPQLPLDQQIVIVGVGEVSAWGSGRTRREAEFSDGFELTAAGVMELAWMMDLITWKDSPAGWVDADGKPVDESDIYGRYHDQVVARCGIRPLTDDSTIVEGGSNDVATVYLESDQVFSVTDEVEARAYEAADPSHTQVWFDGEWMVRKLAGSAVRVPRRATLSRSVGGQIPDGFNPSHWGIPANMLESLDRIAVWNLVSAVDAFIGAGFSPAELLRAVHPTEVSSTQGTGIGGMESLRKVFLDRFLGEDRPQDILQEALPNVVAAHTMQAYVGGYGQMIHPVGACATAAISIEEAVDKLRLGKSSFVVAGGIDDISVESLTGFGDMNATAATAQMYAQGIEPRFFSRAGDRRRLGFLEAEGGGTVLLTRGDIAAQLGLPVLAVVAYAQSFADGAHTSIPAPGIGALGAGRGGSDSAACRALAELGLSVDDIAVVSKHDTSTNANDPNEAELHSRLAAAWGREPGNPLYVVSQKTLTGHAKGGAALFQVAGLCDIFRDQQVPANRALDCLDPVMRSFTPLVWLRSVLDTSAQPVKAGILTSLGFGHVSAVIVLAHPSAFSVRLAYEGGAEAERVWRERAQGRLQSGWEQFQAAMHGGPALFTPVSGRRLPAEDSDQQAHAVEAQMLLDPQARLGADGIF